MRRIQALSRHIEPYSDIFKTLCSPCIYSRTIFTALALMKPEVLSTVCRTCKMTRHIQRLGLIRSLCKHFQGYLPVFTNINENMKLGKEGHKLPQPFFENKKNALILGEKTPIVSIFGLKFPLKMYLSSSVAFYLCFWQSIYRIALVIQKLLCSENFCLHACNEKLFFFQNVPSQLFSRVFNRTLSE